ncbi:MAG TPA: prenyltransferase/squalene oxidase repeat-containing protein, partial [Candidatus Polarisedimenticolia bacterium]|nr:prenyltransferase/squalene oxidase repeat-containing protein [Candidatus Polarisedimenticolia bacterium]
MSRPTATLAPPEARSEQNSARLLAGIEAARRHLLSLQAEDGHWRGELEGDTILGSEYVLVMYFLGRGSEAKVRKAGNQLRNKQLPEGGWSSYPGGPPDASATTKAYFVLKLLGDDASAPHMARARSTILGMGGLDACNSFT